MAAEVASQNSSLKSFTTSHSSQGDAQQLCTICNSSALYKCPKCLTRTCSAKCSKVHKEDANCDGKRPATQNDKQPWNPVYGYSQYKGETNSIEDQHFLQNIEQSLDQQKVGSGGTPSSQILNESVGSSSSLPQQHDKQGQQKLPPVEHHLRQNAHLRRIWMLPSNNSAKSFEGSRHEHFSDTIFWRCTVKFACRNVVDDKETTASSFETLNQSTSEPVANQIKPAIPLVDYEEDEEEQGEIIFNKNYEEEKGESGVSAENAEENEGSAKEGEEGEIRSVHLEEEKIESQKRGGEECGMEIETTGIESLPQLKWLSYTVENIPETIRLITLLRQFLKPKPHGIVVSQSQLDMEEMQQFIRASGPLFGPSGSQPLAVGDNLHFYAEVSLPIGSDSEDCQGENGQAEEEEEKEMRYYPVDPQRSILDNLRNRYVVGHPCFVVVLRRSGEFGDLEMPTIGDAENALLRAENERYGAFGDRPKWQNRNVQSSSNRSNYRQNGRGFRGGGMGRGGGAGQFIAKQQQHPNRFHPYVPASFGQAPPPPQHFGWQNNRGFSQRGQNMWTPQRGGRNFGHFQRGNRGCW